MRSNLGMVFTTPVKSRDDSCNSKLGTKKPLLPQQHPHVVACSAHDCIQRIAQRIYEQVSPNLSSIFIYSMAGTMTLRCLIIAFMALVSRCGPDLRISTPSIFTFRYPLSIITVLGFAWSKILTCSMVSS